MIDDSVFDVMPWSSYIINISHGGVVNTEALIRPLDGGQIVAAGLDVLDPDCPPPDSPLWNHPNVILTSHSAGASQDSGENFKSFY